MKLNVQKLQIGGRPFFSAVVNPFATAAKADRASQATSSGSSSSGSGIISDKVMDELIKNGIPNDVQQFQNMLAKFEQQADFGLGVDRRQLYSLRSYANQVIQQSKYLNKAEEEANKNGAWDEIAISPRGELFVLDKNGKLGKTTLNHYDADKQEALTVGQLLEYRKYSPDLVNNTEVATVVGNSVGMEKISSYIQDIIKTVGTSEDSSEAYVDVATIVGRNNAKRPTSTQFRALQGIAKEWDTLGMDAIFKLKESSKDSNVKEGLNYILSVLPRNMQLQLRANWVASGEDVKTSGDYITSVVLKALMSSRDQKYQYGFDYAADINKAAKTKAGLAGAITEKTRPQGVLEMFFNQNLNRTNVTISDPQYKNQYAIEAKGTVIPSLATDSDSGVGQGPLDMALDANGNGAGKYLDYNKIWFGTDKASREQLSKVYYQGDQVANVWLPVDTDGNIDWDSIHNFAEAEEEIKARNITDVATKNKIHASHNSGVYYDKEGKLQDNRNTAQFAMIHGFTSDDEITSNNLMYKEIGRDREKLYNDKAAALNKKYKSDVDKGGLFTDIIELPIFIKVQQNAGMNASYYAHQGSQVPKTTLEEDMVSQMVQQPPTTQVVGNSALLYQE